MALKEGKSKTTGREYSFWGCTMFPKCRFTERGETESAPEENAKGEEDKMLTGLRSIYSVLLEIRDLLKK